MKVCIIGQGYIGLPTAALFSRSNCEVVGVDISEEMINRGDDFGNLAKKLEFLGWVY